MPETLEPKVKETLRAYAREVKTLPNEAAKRSRFSAVIAELFHGSKAVSEFSRGVEKLIRIDEAAGQKKGRADAYYRNVIILRCLLVWAAWHGFRLVTEALPDLELECRIRL